MAAQVILVHLVHVRVVVSQHKGRFGTNSFETPFLVLTGCSFSEPWSVVGTWEAWSHSAVFSTANPATSSSMFRRKNEHPMKILTTFARSRNSNNYYDTHMRILYLERDPRWFFSRGGV